MAAQSMTAKSKLLPSEKHAEGAEEAGDGEEEVGHREIESGFGEGEAEEEVA